MMHHQPEHLKQTPCIEKRPPSGLYPNIGTSETIEITGVRLFCLLRYDVMFLLFVVAGVFHFQFLEKY